jgi:hypothetical protein
MTHAKVGRGCGQQADEEPLTLSRLAVTLKKL